VLHLKAFTLPFLLFSLALAPLAGAAAASGEPGAVAVPILLYHRFAPEVADSMTVRDDTLAWQLAYLKEHGYTVIHLLSLVSYLRGEGDPPPPRSVVLTADDGHRSVYTDMLPLIRRYRVPVTLFIYPSAISNAAYAMTWPELAELVRTGLFDVQSHTYWHPNFHKEKARLPPAQYEAFVHLQLAKSREVLQSRLGTPVSFLAWPFGIYDEDLMVQARRAGYIAAFSIERRPVRRSDPLLALPRYLITDADRGAMFARLLTARSPKTAHADAPVAR
jgi:peptidoglycan/xylan/chitin deacetylase (PgdA/CDA1 family)